MTEIGDLFAREWLRAAPLSALEAAALNEADGDAELFDIAYRFVRIAHAAKDSRHAQARLWVTNAADVLTKLAGGYFWIPKDPNAAACVRMARTDTRQLADAVLTLLGSVHAKDAARAAPRLDAEDRYASANARSRVNNAAKFRVEAERQLAAGHFVSHGRKYPPTVASVAQQCGWHRQLVIDWLKNHSDFRDAVADLLPRLRYVSDNRRRTNRTR